MNKYFLPLYHSELKPWIKWWILKRLNGGESTLKAVTISSGTLTKVDTTKALSIKEYYGNTIQNGTPTPDSPVEIKTISGDNTFTINGGDYKLDLKSKQLFIYQYSQLRNINRVTTSEETNGFKLTSTGVAGYGFASLPIDDNLIGKQITISCNSTGNKTPSARLFYHNSSGNLASNIGAFWTTNNAHTVTIPSTLPSGATGVDIVFYISQGNNAEGDYATFTNIMINKGTTALPYESYYNYELCKIGDFKDKIYNDNGTWKIEKNVGKVASYNGETITTSYISTTGQLTTGATVYYQLASPNYETITSTNLISQLEALGNVTVSSKTVTISNNSEIPLEVLLEYYGR